MKASLRAGGGEMPPRRALAGCSGRVLRSGDSSPSFLHVVWGQIWPLWVPPLGISHTARQPG